MPADVPLAFSCCVYALFCPCALICSDAQALLRQLFSLIWSINFLVIYRYEPVFHPLALPLQQFPLFMPAGVSRLSIFNHDSGQSSWTDVWYLHGTTESPPSSLNSLRSYFFRSCFPMVLPLFRFTYFSGVHLESALGFWFLKCPAVYRNESVFALGFLHQLPWSGYIIPHLSGSVNRNFNIGENLFCTSHQIKNYYCAVCIKITGV